MMVETQTTTAAVMNTAAEELAAIGLDAIGLFPSMISSAAV
jgi:hypothetical protein